MASAAVIDYLKCGLCVHRYGIRHRIPKMLACGDSHCDECLRQLSDDTKVICPSCKLTTTFSGAGVEGLITNMTIIRMLEKTCDECQGFGQTSPCAHCDSKFCPGCMLAHTKQQLEASIDEVQKRQKEVVKYCSTFCSCTRDEIKSDTNSLVQLQSLNQQAHNIIKICDGILSLPLDNLSMHSDNLSWPLGSPSQSLDNPSVPLDSPPRSLNSLSRPLDSSSRPLDSPSGSLNKHSRPLDSPSRPLNNPSRPLDSPPRPLDNSSRPIDSPPRPLDSPSRPLDSPSRPLDSPTRPMDTPSRPLDSPSPHFDKNPSRISDIPTVTEGTRSSVTPRRSFGSTGGGDNEFHNTSNIIAELSKPPCPVAPGLTAPSYRVALKLAFGSMGGGVNQFHIPSGIIAQHGKLYVADRMNNRICMHTTNGEFISTIKLPHEPIQMTTTLRDMIVSTNGNTLMFFNNGSLVHQIGSMGNGPLQFNWPGDVTRGLHGELYVADMRNHRIQVLDERGNFLRVMTETGSGDYKLTGPNTLAVEPSSGNVYVGGFPPELEGYINIYTSDGRFQYRITKDDIPGVDEFKPDNLTFRDDDLLCISDVANHSVHLFRAGRHVTTFGGPGKSLGQFNCPGGSIFLDDQLIICDQHNNRVQIFSIL